MRYRIIEKKYPEGHRKYYIEWQPLFCWKEKENEIVHNDLDSALKRVKELERQDREEKIETIVVYETNIFD